MGKRLKSLFMALVMMVTTVISINGSYIPINVDESGITVIFHFTNDTNTYDDYRLWLWTIGDGFEARMVNNGTEATYTLQENSSTLKIGYIVKLGEGWDAKDVDSDRYVDLTEYVSGTVNVNLKSKVSGADIDYSNAKKGLKVTSASTETSLLAPWIFKSSSGNTILSTWFADGPAIFSVVLSLVTPVSV